MPRPNLIRCSLPLTCDLKGRREVLHVTRTTSENACLIKCQESKGAVLPEMISQSSLNCVLS